MPNKTILLIPFFLFIAGWLAGCYFLMNRTVKGKRLFLYLLLGFILLNISHYLFARFSKPPNPHSLVPNVTVAVGYAMTTIYELLLFLIIAITWRIKYYRSQKK